MPTTPTTPHRTSNVPRHPGPAAAVVGRQVPGVAPARRRVPRWSVPLAAAVVAAVVLLVGTALGVDPEVRTATGTQTVGVVAAAVTGLVVGFAAWGVRALLGRLSARRPRRGELAWLVTCGVVLLVSLLGPLGATTPAAVALLAVEHLAVGATLALTLRR
ncbi:hypothetical protein H1Q78_12910 [Cellulosimicrobium cellulans]|uniref:DUF6069 family protein n=1 Tax=Cellulosimicrobium cellulans TaxID=1710 RepID=UPI001EDA6DFF|nr:DUF6069 family protein [Cellulosimicrobium cellulans]UKJ62652.1 hypothetical protein H1Q78_12910 [Cellulosimicrobium cellulans]